MGSDLQSGGRRVGMDISIHAPRMGSDPAAFFDFVRNLKISIHAPRMGSDICIPHTFLDSRISIHAPRMGSDLKT